MVVFFHEKNDKIEREMMKKNPTAWMEIRRSISMTMMVKLTKSSDDESDGKIMKACWQPCKPPKFHISICFHCRCSWGS